MDKTQKDRVTALEADRETAGLSYRALGQAASVSDGNIRDVVKGRKHQLSDELWARLAAALPGGKLAALLEKAGVDIPAPASPRSGGMSRTEGPDNMPGIVMLAWNELVPGGNYRKSFPPEELRQLAESIAEKGLLQNIVARPYAAKTDGEDAAPSSLRPARLVAGERRWRAIGELVKENRWDASARNIPVRLQSLDDAQARALALIENLQRQDVPVLEEAEGFKALTALGWDTGKIAAACHIAQRTVQDRLQLFDRLKPVARAALADGQITIDQARAIVSTPVEAEQNELVTKAVRNGYSASSLRDAAKAGKAPVHKAAFDLKQYKGELIGSGAERVFADTEAFNKLQRKAALKQAEEIEASGRFACVTLLEEGQDFDYSRYRHLDEEDIAAEPEEALREVHVFVSVNRWRHDIEIDYGRPGKESAADGPDGEDDDDDDEEASEEQLELEHEIARKKREDEERAATQQWLRDMTAAVAAKPGHYFRREILLALTGENAAPAMWRPAHLDWNPPENLPATLIILRDVTGHPFIMDEMPEDVPRGEVPPAEALGHLAASDAAFLAKWLDGQPDMDVIRLHVRLEASRCFLTHHNILASSDIALAEKLGVTVPDHMVRAQAEDEPDADEPDAGEEEAA